VTTTIFMETRGDHIPSGSAGANHGGRCLDGGQSPSPARRSRGECRLRPRIGGSIQENHSISLPSSHARLSASSPRACLACELSSSSGWPGSP
jgi:hypothetical protein